MKKGRFFVFFCTIFLCTMPIKVHAKEVTGVTNIRETEINTDTVIPLSMLSDAATELFDENFTEQFLNICERYDIDQYIMLAVIEAESQFDPLAQNGTHYGLCQISSKWHADRAAKLGVDDFYDPVGNITLGADLLSELSLRGDIYYALASYRWGESEAKKMIKQGESIMYADKIITRAEELKND